MIPTTMTLHRLQEFHPRSTGCRSLPPLNNRARCLGFWAKDQSQAHSITIGWQVASGIQRGRRRLGQKLWLFLTSVTCIWPWNRISFLCIYCPWCLSKNCSLGLHRFCSIYFHIQLARFPRHWETFAVSRLDRCMSPCFLRLVFPDCLTQRLLVVAICTPPSSVFVNTLFNFD